MIVNVPSKGAHIFQCSATPRPSTMPTCGWRWKVAIDREQMVSRSCRATPRSATASRFEGYARCYPKASNAAQLINQAKFHYEKSGHSGPILLRTSDVAFPAPSMQPTFHRQQSAAKSGHQIQSAA